MASNLKSILLGTLVIFCMLWLPISWAIDSTGSPYNNSTQKIPTTVRAQQYVLDQGYLAATGATSGNAIWGDPGTLSSSPYGGLCWFLPGNTAGFLSCNAFIILNKTCNPQDTAYVELRSIGTQKVQAPGPSGVCVEAVDNFPGYGIFVWLAGSVTYGTAYPYRYIDGFGMIGASVIGFTSYCYPPGVTPPPSETSQCSPQPQAYNTGTVLLYDSGYFEWPSGAGEAHTFNTNKRCPTGYWPYVVMSSSRLWNMGTGQFVQGGGICVQSINPSGGLYQITYLTSDKYTNQTVGWFWATIDWSQVFTLRQFGNVNNSLCPWGGGGPGGGCAVYPLVTQVTNNNQTSYTAQGGIEWTLYCYPNGLNLPAAPTTCAPGSNPF